MGHTTTISAEQHNMNRRAAKARQKAVARARTAHKATSGVFSISTVRQEKANAQRRQRLARQNGQRLLNVVLSKGVLVLSQSFEGSIDDSRWVRDCRDVIRAAKADSRRFEWNRNWEETGRLLIGIDKTSRNAG